MTYDVDLVVPTTQDALQKIDNLLRGLGLQCRLPIQLVDLSDDVLREQLRDERNLIAVTYTDPRDPLREVDILTRLRLRPTRHVESYHAGFARDGAAFDGAEPRVDS